MTGLATGAKSSVDVVASSALRREAQILRKLVRGPSVRRREAQILRKVIRESVATSPDAFLSTVDDIDGKSIRDWEREVKSSTWAVAERGEEVVGIAATKKPNGALDTDIENPETARFIESVWIAGSVRRRGIGSRLVQYLMDVEREKNHVEHFFLWVFEQNFPAIGLYEQSMEFKRTDKENWQDRVKMREIKYQRRYDSPVPLADDLDANAFAREKDWLEHGIRYRILGREGA